MSAPAMRVDFVARGARRKDLAERAVLIAGVLAMAALMAGYRQLRLEAEGLQWRAQAVGAVPAGAAAAAAGSTIAAARDAVAKLAMPWSTLLRELDAAGQDNRQSVALLAIEPDVEHRKVLILAEARDLNAALAYAERLQQASALRYPLLVNHEVQSKDPYQPVRFEVAAEWSVTP